MVEKEIHRPVLVQEVAESLCLKKDGVYIDGTLGAGGHAEAILSALSSKGRLLGIDRDPEILEQSRLRLSDKFSGRILFYQGSFEDLQPACGLLGVPAVDGILLDLGVSSLQLDTAERGFSFNKEAPLDMRMSPLDRRSAEDFISESSASELERIFKEYGEERFAGRIARVIVETRYKMRIETTTQLAEIVGRAIPRKAWPHRIHPATRVFQGLRIAVNRELERLAHFLKIVPEYLTPEGRVAVISYHSLEDRLVKHSFVASQREGVLNRITKKPIWPSDQEVSENPRSRSAKLRIAEKVDPEKEGALHESFYQ